MDPKISNLAHLLRLCVEQVQYCRSERRHCEFVFSTLQGFSEVPTTRAGFRGSSSIACSGIPAEDCGNGVSVDTLLYRFFARFLGARTKIHFQCHGTRTSSFVLLDLGTETFLRLWRHSIEVVSYLPQQFVNHAPGRFDHTLMHWRFSPKLPSRSFKTLSDCLLHYEQLPAHVLSQKSSSDKCNKETEC